QDLSLGTDPLTRNVYGFVDGDPVNRFDPTGHKYTTGCEDSAEPGCYSSAPPPVMPCQVQGKCNADQGPAGYYGSGGGYHARQWHVSAPARPNQRSNTGSGTSLPSLSSTLLAPGPAITTGLDAGCAYANHG